MLRKLVSAHVRFGRIGIPLWAVGLAGALFTAVGGQAVGPVLAGAIGGSVGTTIEQSVVVSSAGPYFSGADDGLAVTDDEGTNFTGAFETQLGQLQRLTVSLANQSGQDANAQLRLNAPAGMDLELSQCASTAEAQLAASQWLLRVDGNAGGLAFDSNDVDSGLGSVAVPQRIDIAAVDACILYAAYVDDADIKVTKSLDGGVTWGSSLTLATSNDSTNLSTVAAAAPEPDVLYVAYSLDRNDSTTTVSGLTDTLNVFKVTAVGTTLTSVGSATLDSDVGSEDDNAATSVDIASPQVGFVFVTWFDGSGGNNIEMAAATESGGTFSPGSVVVVDSVGPNSNVAIAAPTASTAFVSWFDQAVTDLFVDAVSASGTTLSGNGSNVATLDTDAGTTAVSDVASPDASTLFVAWHDNGGRIEARAGSLSGDIITLGSTTLELDDTAGADSDVAIAAPTPGKVFVAWFLDGDDDVLFRRLDAAGTGTASVLTKIGTSDVIVDGSSGPLGNVSIVVPDEDNVFVGYFDDDDSDKLKIAESANGISLTLEPKDDLKLGYYTIGGRLAQIGG